MKQLVNIIITIARINSVILIEFKAPSCDF